MEWNGYGCHIAASFSFYGKTALHFVKRRLFLLGLLIDTILQRLASLKHGSLCHINFNLIAGVGIAHHTSTTVANFKRAKAHNLDFFTGA